MGDEPAPRGRAALLERLKSRKEAQVGVKPIEQPEPAERPPPTGRAALLRKLQESRERRVGISPSVTSASGVESVGSATESIASATGVSLATRSSGTAAALADVTKSLEVTSIAVKEKVQFRGSSGKPIRLSANYIKLAIEKDRGVFEYEVRFDPPVDAKVFRIRCVNQHMAEMGKTKMFDGGACLYLPIKLPEKVTQFECQLPNEEKVQMNIIYKRQKEYSECLHLYNVLFKRIMRVLMYAQMGRNYFNPRDRHLIPQHKLEVYPGFAITVDELEDGLLLCLDTQHRVLRTQNALELMSDLRASAQNFKEAFTTAVIGSCVLTRYNNKTYIIDDIAWDANPTNTFPTIGGTDISYLDYYKKAYDLTIRNTTQPMLIHRKSIKSSDGKKIDQMIALVPELCFLTGLTDAMRSNFKVMKDVAEYTRVTPEQRINALRIYLGNVRNSPDAQQVLADWGLRLGDDAIKVEGRILDSETIYWGQGRENRVQPNCDWTRALSEFKVTGPVNMSRWILFHTVRDQKYAQDLGQNMQRLGDTMGCSISYPNIIQLRDDRNESYMEAIKKHVTPDVQCVVFIFPTLRTDRYAIVKKMTNTQIPVPCQCILSKTLSNQAKVRAITQKIAMQINCKLGGTLWTVRFPFKNWMIMGIDVYHAGTGGRGKREGSVCGVVGSVNEAISRWFSTAIFQDGELSNFYKVAFTKQLEQYFKVNGFYPDKIVIFRDGVGDGQLEQCRVYEIAQFQEVLTQFGLDIPLTFVIVQKRINQRIFANMNNSYQNPPPGTVLDHTVTRSYLQDFFLVPQNVRQGTVNPTHYIVLHNGCNLKPDQVQRLAFKLCHLYYNWSGTIRVPAPCQYAHKLASMVGQYIKKAPALELCDKLFYL